jgi:hypothetical protein
MVMAKDEEVASSFQPVTVSMHAFVGTDVYAKE